MDELQRYSEAISSFDKALEIKPNLQQALLHQACCYALQEKIELAIQNLEKAIQLNPEKYREIVKTLSKFK